MNDTGRHHRAWLGYALITVVLWGVWGAFSGLSSQHGFPDTLVYCVWALTMILPAVVVLRMAAWHLDRTPRAVAYGLTIGLLGAGGQMVLFYALARGGTHRPAGRDRHRAGTAGAPDL